MAIPDSFSVNPQNLRQGFDIPVTEFVGVLNSVEMRSQDFPAARGGTRTSYYFTLKFTDIEVIKSDPPWIFPIVDLDLPYSGGMERSQFGTLAKSWGQFLTDAELANIMVMGNYQLRMHMVKTPGHDYGEDFQADVDPDTGVKPHRIMAAWECVSIVGKVKVGADPVDIETVVLALLDGLTLSQFNSKVLVLPEVKANPVLQKKIIDQVWLAEQQASGKVTVNGEGVYAVAK